MIDILPHAGTPHQPYAAALDVRQLSVAYPSNMMQHRGELALDQVSFQVNRGERVAVVGPNGAGKSTLFKLIIGTLMPDAGTIQLYGSAPPEHLCVAYVPQRNQIDWTFPVTVADVVLMGRVGRMGLFRWPRRRDREIVQECLARVRVADLAQKQIGELSGGQQQRVFVARALAQEAEFVLMDEPLTGLDVPSQEMIFEVLDLLRVSGVTVLVATHDLGLAAERFDRVMLLNRQIVAFDVPAVVFTTSHLLRAFGGHMPVTPEMGEGDA
jgi:manganese/iron transport system ATP-binding protein